jgi:hypothetical protein
MKTVPQADQITPQEWRWVQELIAEVHRPERRVAFAQTIGQWDLAIRQFRKVEQRQFLEGAPTEEDLRYHGMCLQALLAIGNNLVLQAQRFNADELAALNVRRSEIAACVEELEQSVREWHHDFAAEEIKAAQERIFGGPA